MKKNFILMTILANAFLFSSCQSEKTVRIISPEKVTREVNWPPEDLKQVLSVKTLKATSEASYHLILLNGIEKPHTHEQHDLTVFVLKGTARMHFSAYVDDVKPGDVIEIPRGVVHWAEKQGRKPVEVYAVFTPPYDGKDHHEAKA